MKVVLDTNVLVAGLLKPFGAPGEIVRMASAGILELCYDTRIIDEYREVLLRPKFRLEASEVNALLKNIEYCGHFMVASPLPEPLPDPDDEMFLEIALAGNVECLVTGNIKHYPSRKQCGIAVLLPAEFLKRYRKKLSTQE